MAGEGKDLRERPICLKRKQPPNKVSGGCIIYYKGLEGDADFLLFVELNLKTMSPTYYLLSNEEAQQTYHIDSAGMGNCYPSKVRKHVLANDFTHLMQDRYSQ